MRNDLSLMECALCGRTRYFCHLEWQPLQRAEVKICYFFGSTSSVRKAVLCCAESAYFRLLGFNKITIPETGTTPFSLLTVVGEVHSVAIASNDTSSHIGVPVKEVWNNCGIQGQHMQ